MTFLKQDLISLLQYYVERETEEERSLIEDQKACGLTVCLNVHYVSDKEENNVITVHTQLIQSKETEENISEYKIHLDHFYIKSQTVSHQTRKSSSNSKYNGEIISTESIIAKCSNKCEIVYKTYLYKTDIGQLQQTQRSFTRETVKETNNKNVKRQISRIQENASNTYFNTNVNVEDINISKNISTNEKIEKPKLKKMTSIKRLKSLIMKKDVDNNKTNVLNVEKLEPIKKPRKSIKKRLKDWFNKSIIVTPDSAVMSSNDRRKKSIIELKKCISTEDSEMEKEKPTNIVARISMDSKTKKFEIIKDDFPYADEENNDPNEIEAKELHCYFEFVDVTENSLNDENEKCNCSKRCKEAMISTILSKLEKTKTDEEELNKFDDKTRHFIDCPYFETSARNRRVSSKLSTVSSPNSLIPLDNNAFPRGRIGSVVSLNSEYHLDTVFETMKFNNDINCSKETIRHFIDCRNYESYEKGLLQVIDTSISLENLILLFYLTRCIVKQIDDPTCDENVDVDRIMKFSETFLIKRYYDEISKYGNLETYILNCDSID